MSDAKTIVDGVTAIVGAVQSMRENIARHNAAVAKYHEAAVARTIARATEAPTRARSTAHSTEPAGPCTTRITPTQFDISRTRGTSIRHW